MTTRKDKHGRPVSDNVLFLTKCGNVWPGGTGDDDLTVDDEHEILALNWTGPVPKKFEPPRDAMGRPICVGDVVTTASGWKYDVYRVLGAEIEAIRHGHPDISSSLWRCLASEVTLLRFAGTNEDIGAETAPSATAYYHDGDRITGIWIGGGGSVTPRDHAQVAVSSWCRGEILYTVRGVIGHGFAERLTPIVEKAIKDAMAEAWDEGRRNSGNPSRNPYR